MITSRLSAAVRREMKDSRLIEKMTSDPGAGGFLQEVFRRCGKQSSSPSGDSIFRGKKERFPLAFIQTYLRS